MITSITYPSGGKAIPADLYDQPAGTKAGVVVVAYGSDGLTNNLHGPWGTLIGGYAKALATRGFVVLVPHYLEATGTAPGDPAIQSIKQNRDRWQTALADAISHAAGLPAADPLRVGLLGFSLGGHLSLRLRAGAKVLVVHSTPALDGIGSGRGSLTHAQVHHGDADPLSSGPAIKQALTTEGVNCDLYEYPRATHGFGTASAVDAAARARSEGLILPFITTHL